MSSTEPGKRKLMADSRVDCLGISFIISITGVRYTSFHAGKAFQPDLRWRNAAMLMTRRSFTMTALPASLLGLAGEALGAVTARRDQRTPPRRRPPGKIAFTRKGNVWIADADG